MPQMMSSGGFGDRRRFLAEQAVQMEQLFGKADGFMTPITKPAASFKAPSAGQGGPAKPKVASLKPTGNTIPTATARLSALKQNLVGQTGASAGAPAAVGTVGKRESRGADYAGVGLGGAGVLAATQADPGMKAINRWHRATRAEPAVQLAERHLSNFKNLHKTPAPAKGWANNDQGLSRGAARRQARAANAAGRKKLQGTVTEARALKNRGLLSGKQRLAFQAAAGGGGALLAYAGARRAAVQKREKRDVDSLALGAAGGLAVHQGSYIPTKWGDKRAEAKIRKTPGAQEQVSAHRTAHGLNGAKAGDSRWKGYFRSYPTSVPGGKMKRALSYTHSGKTGMATGALAIGGGALATERLRRGGKFQNQQGSRVAKREPLKTSISEDDAKHLVERHGLKGPLPKNLDRNQKMAAYEARYVSAGGHKAEKWTHRAAVADKVKNTGLGVATVGGAGWLATRGKLKGKTLNPRIRHHAETVAGAGATAGGAGELYAAHARRKRSSYSSAPAGVAASALTRMRAYTP